MQPQPGLALPSPAFGLGLPVVPHAASAYGIPLQPTAASRQACSASLEHDAVAENDAELHSQPNIKHYSHAIATGPSHNAVCIPFARPCLSQHDLGISGAVSLVCLEAVHPFIVYVAPVEASDHDGACGTDLPAAADTSLSLTSANPMSAPMVQSSPPTECKVQ